MKNIETLLLLPEKKEKLLAKDTFHGPDNTLLSGRLTPAGGKEWFTYNESPFIQDNKLFTPLWAPAGNFSQASLDLGVSLVDYTVTLKQIIKSSACSTWDFLNCLFPTILSDSSWLEIIWWIQLQNVSTTLFVQVNEYRDNLKTFTWNHLFPYSGSFGRESTLTFSKKGDALTVSVDGVSASLPGNLAIFAQQNSMVGFGCMNQADHYLLTGFEVTASKIERFDINEEAVHKTGSFAAMRTGNSTGTRRSRLP